MPTAVAGPSGRALYDQASSAFVHNMPLETLSIIACAIEDGKHHGNARLAEQYLLLQLTALFTVYSPHDKARFEARIKQWRRHSSGAAARRRRRVVSNSRGDKLANSTIEDQTTDRANKEEISRLSQSTGDINDEECLPESISGLLSEPPSLFLARIWAMCLRFCLDHPLVPSVQSSTPSMNLDTIASTPETLCAALQLPTSVCEALVAGALKLDVTLAQDLSGSEIKSKKAIKASSSTASPDGPGLQASRSMCEWILSAYAPIAIEERAVKERIHLQRQYSKVLRLYTLEVLGHRLNEWEYAREMVRCAQVLASSHELQQEMRERENLLHDIQEAERQDSRKGERRQAAREHAQRLVEEQMAKRAASANAAAIAAPTQDDDSRAQPNPVSKKVSPERRRPQRRDSASSSSSFGGINGGSSSQASPTSSSPASSLSPANEQRGSSTRSKPSHTAFNQAAQQDRAEDGATHRSSVQRKEHDNPAASHEATMESRRGQGSVLLGTRSFAQLRLMLLSWLRNLGPIPAVLCTALAILLFVRRLIRRRGAAHVMRPTSTAPINSAAHVAANHRRAMAGAGSQGRDESVVSFLWRKVADTLKMGTQVTYL